MVGNLGHGCSDSEETPLSRDPPRAWRLATIPGNRGLGCSLVLKEDVVGGLEEPGGVREVQNKLVAELSLAALNAEGRLFTFGGWGRVCVPVVGLGLEKGFFLFAKFPKYPAIICTPEVAILQWEIGVLEVLRPAAGLEPRAAFEQLARHWCNWASGELVS